MNSVVTLKRTNVEFDQYIADLRQNSPYTVVSVVTVLSPTDNGIEPEPARAKA